MRRSPLFACLSLLVACGPPAVSASSASSKTAEEAAGLDTRDLTARETKELSRYLASYPAPCSDIAVSVATCIVEVRSCAHCTEAAKFIWQGVRDGLAPEQLDTRYRTQFGLIPPVAIPVDGSPSRGPLDAPVTIVEFADFECSHCGAVAPELDAAWEKRRDHVRFIYKFYPIRAHAHAEPAARAAIAAAAQGKFWEMHHELFQHQYALEAPDLAKYASKLGLDLNRFEADMASAETTDRLARDRALADTLNVTGTPTIYINGRPYALKENLDERLDRELAAGKH